ncbi:twin-arginine translocation signal domain-containing protein [bacterium]|nr:twin-arginine translocation signal domain-containing protein [bacterium]
MRQGVTRREFLKETALVGAAVVATRGSECAAATEKTEGGFPRSSWEAWRPSG